MSLEVVCPECKTQLIAELDTVECYSCGKVVAAWEDGSSVRMSKDGMPIISPLPRCAERWIRGRAGRNITLFNEDDETIIIRFAQGKAEHETMTTWLDVHSDSFEEGFKSALDYIRTGIGDEDGEWDFRELIQISEVRTEGSERVVKFLRGLLFDGELSGDEVWCLANFLNQQTREVLEQWPANVLVPLLGNAFADGELSAEEMGAIAGALVAIEHQWVSRFAVPESAEEEEAAGAAAPPTLEPEVGRLGSKSSFFSSVERPLLPVVNYSVNVESLSGDGEYTVDLANHTCTCPDWVGKRRRAPERDFRRVCKHVASAFQSLEIEDPMFAAFVEDCCGREKGTVPQDEWAVESVNGKRVLYGYSADQPWVNVFAPQGGDYERFGFNREERRWSYGESPRGFAKFFRVRFGV